jgi:tetratricopeptide (TPR) repeat protein
LATEAIEADGGSPELFHQRSLALFQCEAIHHAIEDCRHVLKLNPFHYAAMVGLGHCHLELGDLIEALFWFRQALDTYPDLEPVRIQVRKLEKAIQEL